MQFTEEELREQVSKLEGWKLEPSTLVRKYMFNEYMKGIAFVDEVAAISEAFEHHPHITVDYKTVVLRLSTLGEDGLTALDIRQAHEFNEAFEKNR
ncbi:MULTISPECIES: 4a-hydroxytetrahydrobiopterin dehydratase [Paenibacillus]|uniref:4a-hydroxytetrahydrobiopterin dehydratase n=1 Tax=Paenibacillus helianthi TaxID=1349432 RepID=A0ABX3EL89_9BACL|nr:MULTISPECIES: 4a-hydroxytetrahydrobiopterin dehydratase [Paenibacillus]OKP75288.1 pterin-4-alpha-carbinolamine dehydratase [Paenibacillus sp. P3E]OKP83305.1 pterin-4-alpha-carbinolamine dehydratase [Paenibacillus helianthi]OKP86613.1 pterin-4-alpha-carbinolamine dehydratase [Paenibacillus sp. P32E]OKP95868.1 pterin-4-alpha-carbinolamine dehydratase [Paenibacillus sp. P46E]